ncbi:MAG: hypothetical protein VB980_04430 [Opitutales bacterium]
MQEDLNEIVAKLADRNLADEEAALILESLKGKDLRLEMLYQRNNATFSMNAPEAYRGGQTLNGKANLHEVQVLVPEADELAARALTYGDSLSLVVRYLEFDDFYRRITFTGSLATEKKQDETDDSPQSESSQPDPGEPEDVQEPTSAPSENVARATPDDTPEADQASVPQVEETQPEASPKPPPSTPRKPTKTGELAVFENPKLPQSEGQPIAKQSMVSSAEIISDVAQRTGLGKEEAALVMDGFWEYLADVEGHYRKHNRTHTLVIPHFGSFRFQYRRGDQRVMELLLPKKAPANPGTPDSSWVDQWSGKSENLSVRRRISVFVAERSGMTLKKADTLLNQLLDTVKALFRERKTIHWARRGTMRESRKRSGQATYRFFASEGFLARLKVPAPSSRSEPHPPPRTPPPGHESRSSSHKEGKPPMPKAEQMTMKVSGCGCLLGPLIAAGIGSWQPMKLTLFLGFLFLVLLVKRALCHKQ